MKRNMLAAAIFMSLGIYVWNNYSVQTLLSVGALLVCYCCWCVKNERSKAALMAIIMLFLGFWGIEISNFISIKKAEPLVGRELEISGKVLESNKSKYGQCIKVKYYYNDDNGRQKSIKIKAYVSNSYIKVEYGDIVNFTAKLKIPDSGTGFGGYNDMMNERSEGILLQSEGNAQNVHVFENKIDKRNIFDLSYLIKNAICERVSDLYGAETEGIMQGILVGEKDSISEETEESFRISGISHTIVVSGMHVNIFVAILMLIFSLTGFGKSRGASLCYIAGAWLFVFICGCGLSAVRAACVTTVLFAGRILKRETDALNCLGVAVVVMFFVNPGIYFNVGFRLSVFSAGAILIFAKPLIQKFKVKNAVLEAALVTVSAQTGIIPAVSQTFGYVGTFGVWTNAVVCPVISILFGAGTISLVLGDVPFVGSALVWFCEMLCRGIITLSKVITMLPMSVIRIGSVEKWGAAIYILLCAALWFMLSGKKLFAKRCFALAAVCFSVISLQHMFLPASNVTFLDTGDSDCAVIQSDGLTVMFDGGGSHSYSVSDNVLIPYFSNQKISRIDAAFITHYHVDHAGGIAELVEKGYIKRVILPTGIAKESFEIKECADKAGIPLHYIGNSDKLRIGDIEIEGYNSYDGKEENNGFVYIVSCNGRKIFISGDVHTDGESIILAQGADLKSDIFKVPHHGSATSGSKEFLKAVSPEISIVCSGKDTVSGVRKEIYKNMGSQLYFTHKCGHIRINLSENGKMKVLPGRNNFYELRNFKKTG